MTTTIYQPNPSMYAFNEYDIIYNEQGIDSISFMSRHEMTLKLFEQMSFKRVTETKGTPLREEIERREKKEIENKTKRYNKDGVVATFEVFKTSKGRSLSSYIMVETYTNKTMDYAMVHKKPKGTYCLVHFMGLHQPTKRVHSETMAIISNIANRKRFVISSFDLATDIKDHREVNRKRKDNFRDELFPISKMGVISTGSSLYINEPLGLTNISRLLFYDKFLKQTRLHKQSLNLGLREWKRLELTISFDLTKKVNRMSAKEYFKSYRFIKDLSEVHEVVGIVNDRGFSMDFLTYQLNSLLDQRVTNNKESRKKFNSVESLERFKRSDFRPYALGLLI